ncbi:MAG: CdaR family protein [Bryobacteraceae bacterium]
MRRFLTHNMGLKLLSLALAFLLWLAYSGSRELTTALSVPVQYRNIPTDLEIGPNLVEEVRLIVRGPSPLLSRVSASPSPVILDLGRVNRTGVTTFSIQRSNVDLPSGVVLDRAIPSQIQIRTEKREVKRVPVVPEFENVPEGYRVESWSVRPDMLTLSGPKSRLEAIREVRTDPIDLHERLDQGQVTTVAYAGDPRVHFTESPQVVVRFVLRPANGAAPEIEKKKQ